MLDEIQEVPDFAAGLKYLQNQGAQLYVTGSNSTVFGERLASTLRGKVLTYPLFPLSFAEFLRFRGLSPGPEPRSTAQKARRRSLWEEYLTWGGFPEVVLAERVERLKVGKDTLYQYLGHFEEALFVRQVSNAAAPGGNKKIYLVDNGLYQRVRDRPDWGRLWENQCFVDLWRQNQTVQFWKGDEGEVDFVTQGELLQATVELTDNNRSREQAPLANLKERYPHHRTSILTLEDA